MVITFKLRYGIDYVVDSYEINGDVIELKRFSSCHKSQITILPLDDVPELPFP
jgi:hypothetical protein